MNRARMAPIGALVLILAPLAARADVGIGLNLGEPTGINVRVGQDRTLEATAGWDLKKSGTNVVLLGDVLFHGRSLMSSSPLKGIYPYAGVGLGFWMWDSKNDDDDKAGVWGEVPLGLDFRFAIPLELTIHIDPGIDVIPQTSACIHWGLGLRYWLK